MPRYIRFLLIGLVLGLFTEIQLKLIAGINPPAFIIALAAYPVFVSLSYAISNWIDRRAWTVWKGDMVHYAIVGFIGLAVEWTLLGNGPGSNAIQLGMFAMWTTFGFGPRVLTRISSPIGKGGRIFWWAFAIAGALLTASILTASAPGAKVVVAVIGLSVTYAVWSVWLLVLAWKSRHDDEMVAAARA